MRSTKITALLPLALAVACSSSQTATKQPPSLPKEPQGEEDVDDDDPNVGGRPEDPLDPEDEKADAPVLVSGAFLTAFGPVKQLPGGAVPVGQTAIGVALYGRKDEKRVEDAVVLQEIAYYLEGGTAEKATVVAGAGGDVWHGAFVVPNDVASKIVRVDVKAVMDEFMAVDVQTATFPWFDPEA